jgi:hypothetical protein
MSNRPKAARVTDAQIEEAITHAGGLYSLAAARLGVTASTVARRVLKSERLQEAVRSASDKSLDLAESALMKAVEAGEAWAVCFFLKCKGEGRGYVERQELTGKNGGPIVGVGAVAEISDAELEAILERR